MVLSNLMHIFVALEIDGAFYKTHCCIEIGCKYTHIDLQMRSRPPALLRFEVCEDTPPLHRSLHRHHPSLQLATLSLDKFDTITLLCHYQEYLRLSFDVGAFGVGIGNGPPRLSIRLVTTANTPCTLGSRSNNSVPGVYAGFCIRAPTGCWVS